MGLKLNISSNKKKSDLSHKQGWSDSENGRYASEKKIRFPMIVLGVPVQSIFSTSVVVWAVIGGCIVLYDAMMSKFPLSHLWGITIIAMLIVLNIGFYYTKANSGDFSQSINSGENQKHRYIHWFYEIKEKSESEAFKSQSQTPNCTVRYLQCVLVDGADESSGRILTLHHGERLLLHRTKQNENDPVAIEVHTVQGEYIGLIFKFCSSIPAGLLDIGCNLISIVYAVTKIEQQLCIALELYLSD